MEIHKNFSFVGSLKKLHENDNRPIENFSANIHCHRNGNIFLAINSEIHERLNYKKFYESAPIYKFTNPPEIINDKIINPSFLSQLDALGKEVVQEPYEGDYIIEGKTSEEWTIRAEIADSNFTVFSKKEHNQEQDAKKYFVELKNLSIDYHPNCTEGKEIEVIYGLANLQLIQSFSTKFLNSKHEFSLTQFLTRGKKKAEDLSAEITLRVIQSDSEAISYSTYFAWFELLISFATGKYFKEIYRIVTSQSKDTQKKIEYWSGSTFFKEGRGIAVMQQSQLASFIKQCASKVTLENFSNKGLGSALRWYTDTFNNDMIAVNFILLCTVLETINKHHSSQASHRLIPKFIYRLIRDDISNILNKHEAEIKNEEDLRKYKIFRNKLETSFSNFNKLGSLRTSLKQILEFYGTPYKDLFPELEFIKVRDSIVHNGFGGDQSTVEVFYKLNNLVIRLILSILEYQGEYIEFRKAVLSNPGSIDKYDLSYKTLSFTDRNDAQVLP
jgi:hypothetical protein